MAVLSCFSNSPRYPGHQLGGLQTTHLGVLVVHVPIDTGQVQNSVRWRLIDATHGLLQSEHVPLDLGDSGCIDDLERASGGDKHVIDQVTHASEQKAELSAQSPLSMTHSLSSATRVLDATSSLSTKTVDRSTMSASGSNASLSGRKSP